MEILEPMAKFDIDPIYVPFPQYVSSCVSATYVCSCVQVLSHWSNLRIRLLASVRNYVNLQCIRESGSVIVLFAAMWLFSYMLPHHVLS